LCVSGSESTLMEERERSRGWGWVGERLSRWRKAKLWIIAPKVRTQEWDPWNGPFICWSLSLSSIQHRKWHRAFSSFSPRPWSRRWAKVCSPLLLYIYNLLIKSNDKKRKYESGGGAGGWAACVCVCSFVCCWSLFAPFDSLMIEFDARPLLERYHRR
jgi:hypothetical protein